MIYARNVKTEDLSNTGCYASRVDLSASSQSNWLRVVGFHARQEAVVRPAACGIVLNTPTDRHTDTKISLS